MIKRPPTLLLVFISFFFLSTSYAEIYDGGVNENKVKKIEEIIKNYILSNPEILLEASKELQLKKEKQEVNLIKDNILGRLNELLDINQAPTIGSEKADVLIIEFFDYQCIYCSEMFPVLLGVIKENNNIQFQFRDWPIFASRWTASEYAALRGLDIWLDKGIKEYYDYHNLIYQTHKTEGELKNNDVDAVIHQNRIEINKNTHAVEVVKRNDQLAKDLGLTGTPTIIIVPKKVRPSRENITVFSGTARKIEITDAIQKASPNK